MERMESGLGIDFIGEIEGGGILGWCGKICRELKVKMLEYFLFGGLKKVVGVEVKQLMAFWQTRTSVLVLSTPERLYLFGFFPFHRLYKIVNYRLYL